MRVTLMRVLTKVDTRMCACVFIWTQYHCQILLAPLSWPQIQRWTNSLQSGICVGFDFRGTPRRFGRCFSVWHRRRNTSFGTPSALCEHWPLTISDRFWQANGPTCKISLTHLHTSPLGHRTLDIIPTVFRDIYGPQQRWDYPPPPRCCLSVSCAAFVHVAYFCQASGKHFSINKSQHWWFSFEVDPGTTLEVFKDFCTRHSNHSSIWSIHS